MAASASFEASRQEWRQAGRLPFCREDLLLEIPLGPSGPIRSNFGALLRSCRDG